MMKSILAWLVSNRAIIAYRLKHVRTLFVAFAHYRAITLSWTSRLSHRYLAKALLLVGLGFSVYAVVLYATNRLTPNKPKATHDAILKARFSSPKPASNIIILDIDERSLATMAKTHGRWPWPRDVMADSLQKLADLGARGILLNVMYSDPDMQNSDADGALDITAQLVRPVAFPIIRLNPENDSQSGLLIKAIRTVSKLMS